MFNNKKRIDELEMRLEVFEERDISSTLKFDLLRIKEMQIMLLDYLNLEEKDEVRRLIKKKSDE